MAPFPAPPSILEPVEELVMAIRGETISIGCTAASGNPPPTTSWLREGRMIVAYSNQKYTINPGGEIIIQDLEANKLTFLINPITATGLYIVILSIMKN